MKKKLVPALFLIFWPALASAIDIDLSDAALEVIDPSAFQILNVRAGLMPPDGRFIAQGSYRASLRWDPLVDRLVLTSVQAMTGVEAVPFETLSEGAFSAIDSPLRLVIRDSASLADLFRRAFGQGTPVPPIDFEARSIIAVFIGTRPTGGFSVEIQRVTRADDLLIVTALETTPAPDQIVIQALTQPYHIISVPRTEAQVRFNVLRRVSSAN